MKHISKEKTYKIIRNDENGDGTVETILMGSEILESLKRVEDFRRDSNTNYMDSSIKEAIYQSANINNRCGFDIEEVNR